ncbi:hypothetical protein [Hasllibacter halocynthiae]|uniref:hypothetical protein n=1 Tax=Hasllibacter halocynthiae TaxID=595589 RepID=UPI001FE3C75F|nr:hypothetical protein [Hasllibacter halocynthiae]
MDAVRLLPFAGIAFFAVPILWPVQGGPSLAGRTAALFGGWIILILGAAMLARALGRPPPAGED